MKSLKKRCLEADIDHYEKLLVSSMDRVIIEYKKIDAINNRLNKIRIRLMDEGDDERDNSS